MAVLKLGLADQGKKPGDPKAYFGDFHESTMPQGKFRGEKDSQWVRPAWQRLPSHHPRRRPLKLHHVSGLL